MSNNKSLIALHAHHFYAPSVRLVVEVDGGYHVGRVTADARRDRKLERAGYRVVRFTWLQITREPHKVGRRIAELVGHPPSLPRSNEANQAPRSNEADRARMRG